MEFLDHTFPTPPENLAADEALLEGCEKADDFGGAAAGILRFYEPTTTFVVVGYGNRLAVEVDLDACRREGIPVLRRASGGGTVVLGPGCLAYALVLPVDRSPEFGTVGGTNGAVMARLRTAAETVLGRPVEVQGHTDLTLDDRKFSGNAQRRRRRALLFHGTFLLSMDLDQVGRLLRRPSREPEYRRGRSHGEFVVNLGVSSKVVKEAVRRVWGAERPWRGEWGTGVAVALAERYGRPEWHSRW